MIQDKRKNVKYTDSSGLMLEGMEIINMTLGVDKIWDMTKKTGEGAISLTEKTVKGTKSLFTNLVTFGINEIDNEQGTLMGRFNNKDVKNTNKQVFMKYKQVGDRITDILEGNRLDRYISKRMDYSDDVFENCTKDLEKRFQQLNIL